MRKLQHPPRDLELAAVGKDIRGCGDAAGDHRIRVLGDKVLHRQRVERAPHVGGRTVVLAGSEPDRRLHEGSIGIAADGPGKAIHFSQCRGVLA